MEPLSYLLFVPAPNVSTAHGNSPQPFSHIRPLFAYTRRMKVTGYERKTDWPKLGPSLLIATALIVARLAS